MGWGPGGIDRGVVGALEGVGGDAQPGEVGAVGIARAARGGRGGQGDMAQDDREAVGVHHLVAAIVEGPQAGQQGQGAGGVGVVGQTGAGQQVGAEGWQGG